MVRRNTLPDRSVCGPQPGCRAVVSSVGMVGGRPADLLPQWLHIGYTAPSHVASQEKSRLRVALSGCFIWLIW